uniref:Flp family type IVb pilin n=1 Tax=viral metagenome TaxID=1070528 RepID=A0A6M3LA33_9ZZZZ
MHALPRNVRVFLGDDSGPELVEWAVVTVILILATFAILQAIGGELTRIYDIIKSTLQGIG